MMLKKYPLYDFDVYVIPALVTLLRLELTEILVSNLQC